VKRVDLKIEGAQQGALEIAKTRLMIPVTLFVAGFVCLTLRLVSIGVFGELTETANTLGAPAQEIITSRADILDRNGVVLATNLFAPSLAARPHMIDDPEKAATEIAAILQDQSRTEILNKLKSSRRHVWIKRKLNPVETWKVNSLGYPGLELDEAEKRTYPHGPLAAHVLGYVGVDNNPFAGVERFFDDHLSDPMRADEPLILSLDIRIQHILRDEIYRQIQKFSAKGGGGIVMDVKTGEILALTSLPDFDPNDYRKASSEQKFNRVLQGVYELGSGFKAFTVAMALDAGTVSLAGGYDATEPLKVDRFTIRDDHPQERWLTVPEIFTYSSNIGSALMVRDLGIDRQRDYLGRFGLLRGLDIEIHEVASPLLPGQWEELESMTISFGHGLAVTPMHLTNGIASVVNGGKFAPATLLRQDNYRGRDYEQVISNDVSAVMQELMYLAVETGTGSKAKVDQYTVGGKTGTAEKPGKRGYRRNDLISSFIGVFPARDPQYAIFVMLDEPRGIEETWFRASAGWTAAPVVGRVIDKIGPLLGVMPEEMAPSQYADLIKVSEKK